MVSLVLDRPSEADLGPRYLRHINGTLQLTQLPTDNNGARLDASWRLRSYCGRQVGGLSIAPLHTICVVHRPQETVCKYAGSIHWQTSNAH